MNDTAGLGSVGAVVLPYNKVAKKNCAVTLEFGDLGSRTATSVYITPQGQAKKSDSLQLLRVRRPGPHQLTHIHQVGRRGRRLVLQQPVRALLMPALSGKRLVLLIAAVVVVLAGGIAVPAGASAAVAALPVVNMEAVLKAAQWDPQKTGSAITAGSGPSVLLVEKALQAEGLLAATYVDGHYGTSTVTAYTRWQKQLGYTGLGANGLPGEASLTKLATSRFTVAFVVRPGPRVAFDGETVDSRTSAMLTGAAAILGEPLRLDQGSYSTSDPTSAGTHAGGGVVDVNVDGWSAVHRRTVAGVLRSIGFAAWVRSPTEGNWPWHIHAVAINDPDLAPEAQAQVGDYYLGRNGLKNNGPDTGPAGQKVTWEDYLRQH